MTTTSTPGHMTLEEWVLRASSITLFHGGHIPSQYIRIRTSPSLYGEWDNEGMVKCFPYSMIYEIERLAHKYGKKMELFTLDAERIERQMEQIILNQDNSVITNNQ